MTNSTAPTSFLPRRRTQRKRSVAACRKRGALAGKTLLWTIGEETSECKIFATHCPECGLRAIVALPEALRLAQPDASNVVCHPGLGGCNQGFEADANLP